MIKKFLLKNRFQFIGVFLGALGGYMYYYFVGCPNGTCRITSNPIYSTLYGVLFGYLIVDFAVSLKKKRK